MNRIGHVVAIWRYPVKSMRGESLAAATFDTYGLQGDRRFAFQSSAAPQGKPLVASRERSALLRYAATLESGTTLETPNGQRFLLESPEALDHLHDRVALAGSQLTLHRAVRPFTDVRPISIISTATLCKLSEEVGKTLDPQRFRSNLIFALDSGEPFAEDAFSGHILRIGGVASLRILERTPRCTMVSLDPASTSTDRSILPHLARHHKGRVGVYAAVHEPGPVAVGDSIFLQS